MFNQEDYGLVSFQSHRCAKIVTKMGTELTEAMELSGSQGFGKEVSYLINGPKRNSGAMERTKFTSAERQ